MNGLALGALRWTAGPLLLAQARRVRRAALRLPEAAGAREGLCADDAVAGAGLRLFILGDSSAAGVGVATQDEALSGQLARRLVERCGRPVAWRLAARTGSALTDLPGLLQAHGGPADLALVVVGVNDVTGQTALRAWRAGLATLHHALLARTGARAVLYSGLPPMHRFPLLPQPLRLYLGGQARRLDAALAAFAQEAGAHHVPLPDLGDRTLIAEDGFHPSAAGVRLWVASLAEAAAQALGPTASSSPSLSTTRIDHVSPR